MHSDRTPGCFSRPSPCKSPACFFPLQRLCPYRLVRVRERRSVCIPSAEYRTSPTEGSAGRDDLATCTLTALVPAAEASQHGRARGDQDDLSCFCVRLRRPLGIGRCVSLAVPIALSSLAAVSVCHREEDPALTRSCTTTAISLVAPTDVGSEEHIATRTAPARSLFLRTTRHSVHMRLDCVDSSLRAFQVLMHPPGIASAHSAVVRSPAARHVERHRTWVMRSVR
ncbi:hypothetical protein OH77DRAFT_338259 [Trametes cingulata]|nr:hypothetical protein OH77DRAFT_338259 [Trametes cingulata]